MREKILYWIIDRFYKNTSIIANVKFSDGEVKLCKSHMIYKCAFDGWNPLVEVKGD